MRKDKAISILKVAQALTSEFSKDPSTKVGCFFVDGEDYTELTRGYNGMPRGVDESRPERFERPLKYSFFEHAERNAIYNLARRFLKGSIVITTSAPTIGCVRALLSVGATQLVLPAQALESPDWAISKELLSESGVSVLVSTEGKVRGPGDAYEDPRTERTLRKVRQHLAYTARRQEILSKDPQGGAAVFVSPDDFTILAEGYSGFPRNADDSKVSRYHGELRETWVEPAIRNAVYNAVRPLLKGSIALVTATTCVECARGVSAVGAKQVVYVEPSADFMERWGASIECALNVLQELNLPTVAVQQDELN
jgi:dCMP deaminase